MARLDPGAAVKLMGSETYSAPAGIVTLGSFEKVTTRSVETAIWGDDAEMGRAICTEVKCSGAVPNASERCTRRSLPPIDRCTIWRRVASRRSLARSELRASGICSAAAHDPTQFGEVDGELGQAPDSAVRPQSASPRQLARIICHHTPEGSLSRTNLKNPIGQEQYKGKRSVLLRLGTLYFGRQALTPVQRKRSVYCQRDPGTASAPN